MTNCWPDVLVLWVLLWTVKCEQSSTTKGGTKLTRMPKPFLVIISPDYSVQETDCVGTFVGGFDSSKADSIALTSSGCNLLIGEVRTARQEIMYAFPLRPIVDGFGESELFDMGVIQLAKQRGQHKPGMVAMELDKNKFQNHMTKGDTDMKNYGFALAINTNPVMAFTVTWNQKNCTEFYKQMKELHKRQEWPAEPPEGTFCVFRANTTAESDIGGEFSPMTINPATPCDDARGSPVMLSDFSTLLGVIIYAFCGETEVAFAISPAFIPPIILPNTTTTTEATTTTTTTTPLPPPPLPRVPRTTKPCSAFDASSKISSSLQLWCTFTFYTSLSGF